MLDDARAKLDELDSAHAEATAGLDTSELREGADDATARLREIGETEATAALRLDKGEFDEGTDDAAEKLDDIGGKEAAPRLTLDDSEFNAKVDEANARLDELKAKSESLNLGTGSGGGSGGGGEGGGEGSLLGAAALIGGGLMPGFGGAAMGLGLLGATAGLAFGGIASALSAAHQASQNVGMTSAQVAAQNFSNAVQVQQAQESVTQARQQAAENAVTSDQQIQEADSNLAETQRNAAASQVQALQQVEQAQQQVETATYNLSEANYNLGQAYVQAREQITQLNDQLADSKLNVQSASLAIQQAIYQQTLTDQNAYSTSIDRAQAALAVSQAQQQLRDSQDQLTDSQYAANLANQQGVDGSQTVIQAKQAQVSAQQQLLDANQSYSDAQTNLTNTELNNAAQVKEAQLQVAQAQQQAAYQAQQDAEAVSNAEQNLTDTIKEQKLQWAATLSTENSAANQFAADFAKLTPAGKTFVDQVLSMKGAYKGLEDAAQTATLPGFTTFLKGVASLAPEAKNAVTEMGGAISNAFARMGKTLETPGAASVFNGLVQNGMEFVNTVLPSVGNALGSVFDLGSSKGAATGLSDLIKGIMQGVSGFAKGIKPYIPDFNQLFEALGKIAKAAGPALAKDLGDLAKALDPLAKFLNSKSGGPFIDALGKIAGGMLTVKGLAKILPGELGKAVGGAPGTILKVVTSPLEKALKNKLSSIFKSAFGGAAKDGEQAAEDEVSNGGGLSGLFGAVKSKLSGGSGLGGAAEEGGEAAGDAGMAAEGAEGAGGLTGMLGGLGAAAGPIGLIGIGLAGLAIGVYEAYEHITWFRDGVNDVFHAVEKTALWLWHDVFDPLWHGIESGVEWLYDDAIKPYFGQVKQSFTDLENAGLWLWHNVLDPVWHGIGSGVSWLYDDVIEPYFGQVKHAFTELEDAAMWLWQNVFDPVWHGIEQGASSFVGAFKNSWDKLEGIFKTPVNFLISHVYDDGIRKFWDDVVGAVSLKSLSLPSVSPLAGGGVIPGYSPGRDTIPAMLSPGEAVLTPGATRAIGGAPVVNALNAAYAPSGGGRGAGHFAYGGTAEDSGQDDDEPSGSEAGKLTRKEAARRMAERPAEHALTFGKFARGGIVQYFSPGGIVSDIGSVVGSVLSGAGDTAKAVAALATGNTTAFVNALAPLIGTSASGTLGQVMIALPKTLVTDAAQKAMSLLGGSSGGTAATSAAVASWMAAAVKAAGVPVSWIPDLEIIARHESSDSPTAVNDWDSNAAAGDPSRGILQLTGATFDQYHVPDTSTNIFDPVANIAAGARYIQSRYGTVAQVPGIVALSQGQPYVGYDSGGALPPGMTVAVNQTGQPEAVLNPQQMQWLQQSAQRGTAAQQAPTIVVNFNGTQVPSQEQMAEIERRLCLAVSGG